MTVLGRAINTGLVVLMGALLCGQSVRQNTGVTGGVGPQGPTGPTGATGNSGVLTYPGTALVSTSSWTWVNQGTATAVQRTGSIFMFAPAVAGDNDRILLSPSAYPATPVTFILGMVPYLNDTVDYPQVGLCLRESSTGKSLNLVFGRSNSPTSTGVRTVTMTNATTNAATDQQVYVMSSANQSMVGKPIYLKLVDNGTNFVCSWSQTGVDDGDFIALTGSAISRTAHMAGGPNTYGVVARSVNATHPAWATFFSLVIK